MLTQQKTSKSRKLKYAAVVLALLSVLVFCFASCGADVVPTAVNYVEGSAGKLEYNQGETFDCTGAKIEVTGSKADALRAKGIGSREIILGVRPEHFVLVPGKSTSSIPCAIRVNEMMGSELHLHVEEENGDRLVVRIPTISLDDDQRQRMGYGATIHVTFEGKVMHFFDPETERNLLT